MCTRILGTVLLALTAVTAGYSQEFYRGQGYIFYGPGHAPGGGVLQQIGGGGEGFLYKGLGVGGELGYLFPSGGFTYGLGLLSLNGSYHLNRSRHAKLSPFVTAGYSLAFRNGHANLLNFGGGVTWWMAEHVGLRMEIRDYVWSGCSCGPQHSPQAQIGLSFR
ncbi:MAG TPA: hypothetical protein VLX58_18075 [Bryobacteraceae bacterium]|nr:hypothetical protein [Bryobacteraceae bacterium]